MSNHSHQDCPTCGHRGVWADMLIFGCVECGCEFEETTIREPIFTPFVPEPSEE